MQEKEPDMSTRPARRTKPARTPKHRLTAPAGLVAAFAMATPSGATAIAALHTAERAYEPARRIIDLLHGRTQGKEHQDLEIEKVIERACAAYHGGVTDDGQTQGGLMADTGFDIGFAVCWLLMMAVNGNDGVR